MTQPDTGTGLKLTLMIVYYWMRHALQRDMSYSKQLAMLVEAPSPVGLCSSARIWLPCK